MFHMTWRCVTGLSDKGTRSFFSLAKPVRMQGSDKKIQMLSCLVSEPDTRKLLRNDKTKARQEVSLCSKKAWWPTAFFAKWPPWPLHCVPCKIRHLSVSKGTKTFVHVRRCAQYAYTEGFIVWRCHNPAQYNFYRPRFHARLSSRVQCGVSSRFQCVFSLASCAQDLRKFWVTENFNLKKRSL